MAPPPITRVRETHLNETRGHLISEPTEWYEPFTEDRARLFRSLQREYGRCVSKVYIDDASSHNAKPIGWVFQKRRQYEDTGRYGRPAEYYTHEVWVELATDAWGNGL